MGRRVDVRAPSRRDRCRLRASPSSAAGRTVDDHGTPPRHRQHRREGHGLAPAHSTRHARARVDAVRCRQRAGQGSRDRPPARRVPPGPAPRRDVAGPGRRRCRCPTTCGSAARPRPRWTTRSPRCRRRIARTCHALTHTTFSPNVAHGGQKTNIIPDAVDLDVDIRTVPGHHAPPTSTRMLAEALGDLAAARRVVDPAGRRRRRSRRWATRCGTRSPRTPRSPTPGPLRARSRGRAAPTPAFYRDRGRVAYGAGLFSPDIDMATFGNRFHGNDERIDVESLALATEFWIGIARSLLG